jgi:hypothetical protein
MNVATESRAVGDDTRMDFERCGASADSGAGPRRPKTNV